MRCLLSLLLVLTFFSPAWAQESSAAPQVQAGPEPLESMIGEALSYDIAFLWFDRLAEAQLTLERGERPGTLRAVLEAKTLGVAAWLTRDRVQRYESLIEITPEGRLRTLRYESRIIKGKGRKKTDKSKRFTFDYDARIIRYERTRGTLFELEREIPMEGEVPPNDILTAFYNFRAGFFGPVEDGRTFAIPAFKSKGIGEIKVAIISGKKRRHDFFPEGGVLAKIKVDREVFETSDGSMYVWFDAFGRPARGIVENVIGLGDVKGTLRSPKPLTLNR